MGWAGYALQLAMDRRDDMTGPLPLPVPPEPVERALGRAARARPAARAERTPAERGSLRQRVTGGEPLLGTFSVIPSTDVVELVALAGFDFVILDMEHGPYTIQLVHACLLAAAAHRLPTVVRVPEHNPALIGSVLDVGADGVLVPQVRSADEAAAVVDAARFAPRGSRGSNPWVRAAGYAGSPQWLARSNEDTLVMVMVEGTEAVRQIDRIIATDGLDAIFLGPVDMSHALGVPGQPEHPRVLSTLVEVAGKARASDVAAAVFAPDAQRARSWWAAGLTMVACGVDSRMVLDGLRATARDAAPPGR